MNYWKVVSSLIVVAIALLFSVLSFMTGKILLGIILGIIMVFGLLVFAYNFVDDEEIKW